MVTMTSQGHTGQPVTDTVSEVFRASQIVQKRMGNPA